MSDKLFLVTKTHIVKAKNMLSGQLVGQVLGQVIAPFGKAL